MRINRAKGLILFAVIFALTIKGAYSQSIKVNRLLIYDYDSMFSFYESQIISKRYSKIQNTPLYAFTSGDKLCAFYESYYGYPPAPPFFFCVDSNLSNTYMYSASVFKDNALPITGASYNKTLVEYFGGYVKYQNIVTVFKLGDNLYSFHKLFFNVRPEKRKEYKIHAIIYDKNFNRLRESTLDIYSYLRERGIDTRVVHIEVLKVTDSSFAIITYVGKVTPKPKYLYEVITAINILYFNDKLHLIKDIALKLPFTITLDHDSKIDHFLKANVVNKFLLEPKNEKIKFYFPIVLTEEEIKKNNILSKIFGKQKNDSYKALFAFIYDVNLRDGDANPLVLDLGNPNKIVTSLFMKKLSDTSDLYYFVSAWGHGKTSFNKYGIDIIKFRIDEGKVIITESESIGYSPYSEQKSKRTKGNKAMIIITDIIETKSKYIISTLQRFLYVDLIMRGQTGALDYYVFENHIANPEIIVIDKKSKAVNNFVLLKKYLGIFQPPFYGYNVSLHNIASNSKLIQIGNNLLFMFPLLEAMNFPKRLHEFIINIDYTRTYYGNISIEKNRSISVTPAKLFGLSDSNMSGYFPKTYIPVNGKWYVFYTIDNFVPAVAIIEFSDDRK